ncbi:Nucleic acid-binding, OB-fold [Cynara cardunculus var. scolymus]|uniref:Nucleic acid-binding, OB-fold n=1 Tax=Cynara cardunculus var. scolymus TaxID=59895 RepID=A0A103YJ50_CYNCS|nr:Nucleic acid-binding, OB-fold [Cynara cardunculus var. scolymus]
MATKGGRKNLKRAVNDETLTLQPGQSIMQVVSLRGSNSIEVTDAKGEKALAFFPAKFQKSMPEIFKSTILDSSSGNTQRNRSTTREENELDSSEDDGLPPLEANTNRRIPVETQSDTGSDSEIEDS